MVTKQATFVLSLDENERDELLQILEQALIDVHAERRRTEAPDYQEALHRKETVIHDLVTKIRQVVANRDS